MTTPADTTPVTLTVERGLEVLRAFRADRAPLSNAELVRRTGFPKATVSRITATLIRIGFLRRVSGGRQFELSAGALSIGHAYLEASPVTRLVNPFLQTLADKLELCVALAVPDHLDMLYIACRTSARIATLRLGVGTLLPMETTSVGRAHLYALPEAQRRARIAAILATPGKNADIVRKNLDTAFEDLRTTGVCMAVGEYQRNAYGIALPLTVGRTRTLMSLNCGAVELEPDMTAIRKRAIPALHAAGHRLTELLADVDCEP
ncbi:IclR family transcriptional regulator [Caballeronia novacaledonica]|uniref:IclR family transcriptional regulator n=1 Tax=Caballeronia novacaledonica TaxID=1544861 RepID=UPI001EE289FE|nr:IclR family transcriptional regulator [Caballeronia novacaledonica]GJH10297.1 IclR family transcriptional regulator [Caballeronia novacaledonica]